ncbi:MurR/RpiR family transcriptional regulator [Arthrobacter antioxidans]|uniref:MurR/RpiR family transcriptional regulator n=1 Tax=Arthrobacter antioxidans TaxID=2895818 RepID=UPI001FFF2A79|nr:MurR/RpiR family transcriptional regulator [Arthrobacter antioxidans]
MGAMTHPLPPEGPDEISAKIRASLSGLPPAAQKVARLILDDPDHVAGSSMSSLEKEIGVSGASIVRAAKALGYAGYPQLRLALAAASGRGAPPDVVTGGVRRDDATADIIAKLAHAEQQAIRETAAHLDPAVVEAAAGALARANRILSFGVGASGLVAADLQQKLTRAGFICHSPADLHLGMTEAALLGAPAVAVIVSDSGETREALAVLEVAAGAGAVTIALTGAETSSLARTADYPLIAAGSERGPRPGALSSRIGQLLVVDCLFVALTHQDFASSDAALTTTRAVITSHRNSRPHG